MEFLGTRKILYSDIDYNHHLNNTKYTDIITDLISKELQGQRIYELELVYSGEASLFDTIQLYIKKEPDESLIFKGVHARGRCFEARVRLVERDQHQKVF